MGHIYLGALPRTYRWKEVIELLKSGADLNDLADASFFAAHSGLQRVPNDAGFLSTVNSIFELAAAAREKDVSGALENAGIPREHQSTSFDVLVAVSNKVTDDLKHTADRSDIGQMARDSFVESLTRQVQTETGSLFQAGSQDIKKLTQPFRGKQFKVLMHEFYSAFISRFLSYHLSREIPNHVGPDSRFADMAEHAEFNRAFDLHCRQTVRISDEFTPGWVGKAAFENDISRESVKKYAHVAFKKIASEFERGGK